MAFEKFKKFATKWKDPDKLKEQEIYRKAYKKAYEKARQRELRKAGILAAKRTAKQRAAQFSQRGGFGSGILDTLGESARLEFGGQKKGKHYLENVLGSGTGLGGALQTEFGFGSKRKKHKKKRSQKVIILG